MKKGALLFNKYYGDDGMAYINNRLSEVFSDFGVTLECPKIYASFSFPEKNEEISKYDFALFFDKDIALARYFERCGVRVFNSSKTLALCDDKEFTYSVAAETGVKIPKSVLSPLLYDVSDADGKEFISLVKNTLDFPIVVKENVGSQGRQVYLADDTKSLETLYKRLKRVPHIYQEYIAGDVGSDTRVYIVGRKAVFAVKRENTTDFRSNVFLGGKMEKISLDGGLATRAEKIAEELCLEYGSVDFIGKDADIFLEANSNAYLKTPEKLGANIAATFAAYVTGRIYGTEK